MLTRGNPREMPVARSEQDEQRQVERVRQDLLAEYAQLVEGVVDEQLGQVMEGLRRAPVRDFVPTLAHRGARERLRRLV